MAKKPKVRKAPVEVSEATLDDCIEHLAGGGTLAAFCREPGRPNRQSVVRVVARDPILQARFTEARNFGFDALAEDVLRLCDEPIPRGEDGRADAAIVQHRKLQADVRLRLLSKWATAKYGDRLEVAGDPRNPLQIELSVEQRRAKVLQLLGTAQARRLNSAAPARVNGAVPLLPAPAPTPAPSSEEPTVFGITRSLIERAQHRWRRETALPPMDSVGVAIGPSGTAIIVCRRGNRFDESLLIVDQGQVAVRRIHEVATDRAVAHVDVSTAPGMQLARQLEEQGVQVVTIDLKGGGRERIVKRMQSFLLTDAVDLPPDARLFEDDYVCACCLALTDTPKVPSIDVQQQPVLSRNRAFNPYYDFG